MANSKELPRGVRITADGLVAWDAEFWLRAREAALERQLEIRKKPEYFDFERDPETLRPPSIKLPSTKLRAGRPGRSGLASSG